ncbi:hypothetical protein PLESTB_001199400 [Pleodorina starrii]|uniref:Uncharacterized protein n=1 Tax=Pleodorina starrii TaxID=330485 RepID=A0A9W6BS44_9CHLO|nr:hypothetical protein PLESTB_001199400 [Pleodorina starrii]GLC71403.1 hypothetical protein PLESTF_001112100 [Pleodorina starrii]
MVLGGLAPLNTAGRGQQAARAHLQQGQAAGVASMAPAKEPDLYDEYIDSHLGEAASAQFKIGTTPLFADHGDTASGKVSSRSLAIFSDGASIADLYRIAEMDL